MKHVIVIETSDASMNSSTPDETGNTSQKDCIRSLELACAAWHNNFFIRSAFDKESAVSAVCDMY